MFLAKPKSRKTHSVDLKRRPPKSLPWPLSCGKSPSLSTPAFSVRGSGPQGLRRPRFSFFRFTCQTPRNLAAPSPANARAAETPRIRHGHKIMAGCSFTVNSEGLRRRAIAPKRAARREVYIGFRSRHCQRPRRQNERCEFVDEAAIFTGSEAARQSRGTTQRSAWIGLFTHLAPHCGHIPPPFFAQSCRGRRNAGKRQRQLTFQPRRSGRLIGPPRGSFCAFSQGVNQDLSGCRTWLRIRKVAGCDGPSAIATAGDGGLGPS